MKNYLNLIYLILSFLFLCCAAQQVSPPVRKPLTKIPAGVDSLLAVNTDSIAAKFLIPEAKKENSNGIYNDILPIISTSDSLWKYYLLLNDILPPVIKIVQPQPLSKISPDKIEFIFFVNDIRSNLDYSKFEFSLNKKPINAKEIKIIKDEVGDTIKFRHPSSFSYLQKIFVDFRVTDSFGNKAN